MAEPWKREMRGLQSLKLDVASCKAIIFGQPTISRCFFILVDINTDTPWKINIEHTNHPFREENDLNQTYMIMLLMCKMLIFQGVHSLKLTVSPTRKYAIPTGGFIFQLHQFSGAFAVSFREDTLWTIKMEHNKEVLEADFSFQLGDFGVPCQTLGG